jgi:hypothetical protein
MRLKIITGELLGMFPGESRPDRAPGETTRINQRGAAEEIHNGIVRVTGAERGATRGQTPHYPPGGHLGVKWVLMCVKKIEY